MKTPNKVGIPIESIHPGEILLEEFIKPNEWTQTYVAEKLNWTQAKLSDLINGKRGVTANVAIDLALFLGTSAYVWTNLQAGWDLSRAYRARVAA